MAKNVENKKLIRVIEYASEFNDLIYILYKLRKQYIIPNVLFKLFRINNPDFKTQYNKNGFNRLLNDFNER